jgi:histidyl-tRNA synthetase
VRCDFGHRQHPQKGRYRQFHQCDIDLTGEPGVLAEAELIEATTQALAAVGRRCGCRITVPVCTG